MNACRRTATLASESDDDARSFGSEPDLSAMSALRVTTEAGSSAFAHVFDELLEDTPRGFGHDLEAADTARLQAALDAFDERVYLEREDSDPDEAARSPERRPGPRRVHADRQAHEPGHNGGDHVPPCACRQIKGRLLVCRRTELQVRPKAVRSLDEQPHDIDAIERPQVELLAEGRVVEEPLRVRPRRRRARARAPWRASWRRASRV